MQIEQLQKAVANLNWNLSFYDFCRDILEKNNQTNEQLENNTYCLEKWEDWQKFNSALHYFDSETIERIVNVYEQRQINQK